MKKFFKSKKNILIRAENFYNIDFNLTNIIKSKNIFKILEKLFNDKAILFKEKINYKPPGARNDKLHQDAQAGWNKFTEKFISVLIPLEKVKLVMVVYNLIFLEIIIKDWLAKLLKH